MFNSDNINVSDVDDHNWQDFQKLTNEVLHSNYPEALFNDCGARKHLIHFSKIVKVKGNVIAGAKAYSVTSLSGVKNSTSNIVPLATYIETIVVDNRYRDKGIGTYLIELIEQESQNCFTPKIILHTPKNNTKVIKWYLMKGYRIQNTVEGYYSATELDSKYSPDAFLLEKDL
ncbi:similar to Saccharomyces cerevisiae YOR253W NAT5 Subunit of the N-terminal acetyltransferase NatA (Nat1p, Ard1p, Nat5p) (Partial) [Maudiozyma barnettii]|nr:similar to Saccharomyces cerevisiae YOR253W NAT5 Subunit of the N-terminal acetyltransferase NatA (Nat1p, Ard1p, Nat5p) (Partial) [Kazachstania barnettii]